MLCGTNNVWKLILGNKMGCPKSDVQEVVGSFRDYVTNKTTG